MSKVRISNIKGISELEFSAGSLTVLSGGNGQNKTSALDALRACFCGGHDPSLIRLGEKKGEVSLLLDDGATIRCVITEKATTRTIQTKDGAIVQKPAAYLESLASSFSFDPFQLLTADKKERAAFVLTAMPVKFAREELTAIGAPDLERDGDLTDLANIRQMLYEQRKGFNRTARDAEGTVITLTRALPEEDGIDWAAKELELAAERKAVDAGAEEARAFLQNDATVREHAVINDANEKIAALLEQVAAVKSERDRNVATYRQSLATQFAQISDQIQPEAKRLDEAIGNARAKNSAATRAAGAKETIDHMRKKIRESTLESEKLDRAIIALDDLKKSKLASLPVEGVEFLPSGDITVDGVSFDNLNTASQLALCVRLGRLKLGKLALMVADRLESFEPEMWEQFVEMAPGLGVQVVGARVTSGPLKVRAI